MGSMGLFYTAPNTPYFFEKRVLTTCPTVDNMDRNGCDGCGDPEFLCPDGAGVNETKGGKEFMRKFTLTFTQPKIQTIMQREGLTLRQLSLEEGETLDRHHAAQVLTIVVLSGEIEFVAGDESAVLRAHDLATIDAYVEHAVRSITQSVVLLVLTPDAH
jgi:quercetin dioxygenase-like cupin family protein